jgi:Leucine Rich repeat
MQFTVRWLMVVVMLVAILLAGAVFTARLVRLSSLYEARAASHAQRENRYRKFIAIHGQPILDSVNNGEALVDLVYHQKLAEHHRSLKEAFERASRRPWERAPRDVGEPTYETLRAEYGPPLIQLAVEHQLRFLDLSDMGIGRDQLRVLSGCTELLFLDLWRNPITDQDLVHLRSLKKLWSLNLSNTRITDAGLDVLKEMPALLRLNLANTRITDAGVDVLKRMPGLLELNLYRTGVTKSGLDSLSHAIPNCAVIP